MNTISSLSELKIGDKLTLLVEQPNPFSRGEIGDEITLKENNCGTFDFEFEDGVWQSVSSGGLSEAGFCASVVRTDSFTSLIEATPLILDKINLLSLNICVWQGRKAMTTADLAANGLDTSKLPPAALANLGSKRIVAPEMVAPFNVLKRNAAKECAKYGVRFGSCGYAVPEEKMGGLVVRLKALQIEFRERTEAFVEKYEEAVNNWISENPPEWAPIIRASADSADHVAASLSFKFAAMKIVAPGDVSDGLDEELGSLYGQLCSEIKQMAKIAYETSFKGKSEVTQRALRPISAIRDKLNGLSFLDPSVEEIIRNIDDAILCAGKKGPIVGKELNTLSGLIGNQLMHMGTKKIIPEPEEIEGEPLPIDIQTPPEETVVNTTSSINWDF